MSSAFAGAKVYATTQQTPTTLTWTPVTFDSEDYDTNGYHEPTTHPTYITVPSTGYYEFYFSGSAPDDGFHWACAFRVNGSGTSSSPATSPSLSRPIQHGHTDTGMGANQPWCYTQLALTGGDHVEALVYFYGSHALGTSSMANFPEDASTLIVNYLGT